MLTLWGRRSAFNVQKVLWLVGELGLPHAHVDAGGASRRMAARPAYRDHVMRPFEALYGRTGF